MGTFTIHQLACLILGVCDHFGQVHLEKFIKTGWSSVCYDGSCGVLGDQPWALFIGGVPSLIYCPITGMMEGIKPSQVQPTWPLLGMT